MNRRECLISALSAATLASVSEALTTERRNGEPPAGNSDTQHDVQTQFGVKIPMRDGVRLNATLYLPKDQQKPRPAIFNLTPYIADNYHPEGISFAGHGYPYLSIDVRGRGNSEGEFVPFFNDPADGHDVVEWIAKQAYCNGKVGALGLSYTGFTQWAAVRGEPQHLATIVPSAPCWVGFDYPMRHNIFFSYLATWLTFTWGNTSQRESFGDQAYWNEERLRFLESGLPFKELDKFSGFESKPFQEWLKHPHQDEYWDRANPTPEQFAKLSIPILSITGMYDGDQPGTMEFYRHHLKHAGQKAQHYLVMGPWDHGGVRKPKAEFMGLKFGPDSVLDMEKLHREWYGWTMEGGAKPAFLKKRVSYYVTDAEKWRYADTLEDVTARFETLYLQSTRNPTDVFRSGALASTPADRSGPDHYVYDPHDLSRPRLESSLIDGVAVHDHTDQRLVLAPVGSKLIYHSDPFESDTEVSGFFKLSAWISIDQPDTDFSVSIFEIGLDGSSVFLTRQHLRARYREGLRVEKLIDTTEPLRYDFNRFFFVSRRIKKNHRLRLVIEPNDTIHWQRNYNSGKPVAEETMKDARTVSVRLFHDRAHPSALSIPIGRLET